MFSLFNGISTFVDNLMPKLSLLKNSSGVEVNKRKIRLKNSKGCGSRNPCQEVRAARALKTRPTGVRKKNRSHFSFTFDSRRAFLPSFLRLLAGSICVCPSIVLSRRPVSSHQLDLSPSTKSADFGLKTHRKDKYISTPCLGVATVFLFVLENISSLQNSCTEPKNNVEI